MDTLKMVHISIMVLGMLAIIPILQNYLSLTTYHVWIELKFRLKKMKKLIFAIIGILENSHEIQ